MRSLRHLRRAMLSAVVVGFMLGAPGAASASCGAGSCPFDAANTERNEQGKLRVGYLFEYSDQDDYRMGRRSSRFGESRGHHDEQYTINRTHSVFASLGVTDRFSLEARLPVVSRSHAHVHHHHGTDIPESWDLSGLGDLALRARYAFRLPDDPSSPTLSAILGGEFPTGKKHDENGAGDEAEPAIQPGSNSHDLIVGLSSLQTFPAPTLTGRRADLPVFAGVEAQFNGPGTDDYRRGDTFTLNVGAVYPLTRRLGLMTQLNVLLKDRDGVGQTREEVRKTGGEFVYLSPGLEWRPTDAWRMFTMVQLPVYQRVNSLQVVSEYNVLVGAECAFELKQFRK